MRAGNYSIIVDGTNTEAPARWPGPRSYAVDLRLASEEGGAAERAGAQRRELDNRALDESRVVPEPLTVWTTHPLVAIHVGRLLAGQVELVLPWPDFRGAADAGIGRAVVHRKGLCPGDGDDCRGRGGERQAADALAHVHRRLARYVLADLGSSLSFP